MGSGESTSEYVSCGEHHIEILDKNNFNRSVYNQDVYVGEEGLLLSFAAAVNPTVYQSTFGARNQSRNSAAVYANNKMQQKPKRNKGFLSILVIVVAIGVVLAVGDIGSESETNNSQTVSNAQTKETELTPEQQARILRLQAINMFDEGNYKDALSLCSEISQSYPDTTSAEKIDELVNDQLSQYEEISANDLFQKYSDNVVNADKYYTDTVLRINGTIENIGKTNNDKNLAILLECDGFIGCVQLNFDVDFEDEISEMSIGDKISVVGKCTGTSGRYEKVVFSLFSDAPNVMIADCCIIKEA